MKGKILRKSITGILALSMLCSTIHSTCSYAEEIPDITNDTEEFESCSYDDCDEHEHTEGITIEFSDETSEEISLQPQVDEDFPDNSNNQISDDEDDVGLLNYESTISGDYTDLYISSVSDIVLEENIIIEQEYFAQEEDTSTDAWFLDYPDSTINDTGLAADGTYGSVTLGHFSNTSYAGELLVYGVAKIEGKYYHVRLMESPNDPAGNGLGIVSNSSWRTKAPYVTAIHFVKGSADGVYSNDMVKAGVNCRSIFRTLPRLTTLDLVGLDLTATEDMGHFFCQCENLSYINFGTVVENVKDVTHLFGYCYGLKFVNLSNFDFSNVTIAGAAFTDCKNLETILTPKNIQAYILLNVTSASGTEMLYYYKSAEDKENALATGNYSLYGHSYLPTGLTESIRISRNPTDAAQYAVSIDITTVADPPAIYIGDTSQVTANVTWDNASTTGETTGKILWEISDPSIASIDDNGKAIGLKPGTVWVTAKYADDPSVWGRCAVTVLDDPVEENRRLFVHDNREGIEHTDMATGSVTKLNGNRFLMIEDLTDTDELELLNDLLSDEEYDIFAAYDINLFYNQNGPDKDEDFGNCSMTIALPEDMDLSLGEVYPVSVKDGKLEKISEYSVAESDDGVGYISITTTHFSPYALVYKENAEEVVTPSDTSSTSIVNNYPTIIKYITTENTIYKTVIENENPPAPAEVIFQSLALSPVTGGYSGAPPGRPPDMFGIVVLLLLIGFMLGISDKVELPFDLLIEINALYEDIRAIRAGIYALNAIKTALQSEAISEKRREIKKNCDFSDLWFAYPNFV